MKIPLFPLHTVLFPGMALPLRIFEPRYQEMVNECLTQRTSFGVVLIRAGAEVGGPAQPHGVGTLAGITKVARLPDGRINLETLGQERFRVLTLHDDRAFLQGTVELFPLQEVEGADAQRAATRLRPWVWRYLQLLSQATALDLAQLQLPTRPAALAYLAAMVAQLPLADKQGLLTAATAADLLQLEIQLYRREISLLRGLLQSPQARFNPAQSPN